MSDTKTILAALEAAQRSAPARRLARAATLLDNRPRFKDGRLKDEYDRLSEELDLEMLHDPRLGGDYYRQHKAEFDRFNFLRAERERLERSRSYVRPDGMTQTEFEKNKAAIYDQERRRHLRDQIRALQTRFDSMPTTTRGPAEDEDDGDAALLRQESE
jgi:hypothetical protein